MRRKIENLYTCAHLDHAESRLEARNRKTAREIARESIVLLENNGGLPLDKNMPIALYGNGTVNTVKGGSGSGEVNERYSVSIYEGLKQAGFVLTNEDELMQYKQAAMQYRQDYEQKRLKEAGFFPFKVTDMSHMDQGFHEKEYFRLTERKATEADTCIYIIARMSGEGADRLYEKGDYFLSETEEVNLHWCAKHYKNVILCFNTGGPIDLGAVSDISFAAILNLGMLGEEGGNAFADILSGQVSPSGHLTSTWAKKYADIPFGDTYSKLDGRPEEGDYREDIFVGYRYYDRFGVKPRFFFGQGLSYTRFDMEARIEKVYAVTVGTHAPENGVNVRIKVKNVGERSGKAVPQVYLSLPEGKLVQPASELVGFAKTKSLMPGETEEVSIFIPYYYMASFDEDSRSEIMEAGQYVFYLGENIAEKQVIGAFSLTRQIDLQKRKSITSMTKPMDLLRPNSKKPASPIAENLTLHVEEEDIQPEKIRHVNQVMDDHRKEAEKFVGSLSVDELVLLLTGDGVIDMVIPAAHDTVVPGATGYSTSKLTGKGLPSAAFCDGPAGLRLARTSVVKKGANKIKYVEPALDMLHFLPGLLRKLGRGTKQDGTPIYMYATAFPTGTALAQTWNESLWEKMGDAVGSEMEDYGVNVWLAPGMNIHRNPLCGRNYEYYSEDPLLAGKAGAALVRGVQKHEGRYATIKHFCCNNQEDQRQWTSANVSERALREIYLRGFGMVVKEANGRALMSSYNRINGIWSGVNHGTLTIYLREECGFAGIVVTDWDGSHEGLEAEKSIEAGITMLMAGDASQRKAIKKAIQEGRLDEKLARERAIKNVQMILAGGIK